MEENLNELRDLILEGNLAELHEVDLTTAKLFLWVVNTKLKHIYFLRCNVLCLSTIR